MRFARYTKTLAIVAALPLLLLACSQPPAPPAATTAAPSPVERGKYLVTISVCDDCHSPKTFGPDGPAIDTARRLSGHPAADKLPAVPAGFFAPDKFGGVTTNDLTAWVGPWGTSYPANLTPDKTTGLGSWTEDMFIKALRSGKHQGEGRPILPPMPWQNFSQMTDADLKAVWAYLQTLPPVQNAVPDPVPPVEAAFAPGK